MLDTHGLYKWIKIHLFTPRLLPSSAFPSLSSSAQVSIFLTTTNPPSHVRIRSSRQVGGLLRDGEGRQGAPGGRVPECGYDAQDPCQEAGHPHPGARRKGGLHLPLLPFTRVSPSPLCPRSHYYGLDFHD